MKLKRPFFCMAPLADVTDPAFRQIIAKYSRHGEEGGGPDVFWTEFVSADGLCSSGREILKRDLAFSENERPIVAQIFSANPETIREASALCRELGFDGIDLNMGCPDRSVEKQGSGAAHIKDYIQAGRVIAAAKEGAGDLPVSVKTRVGYNKIEISTWIPFLLEQDIAALTIHARTRKEMSKVPARWEHVREVVELRNEMGKETLIIGNGDLASLEEGRRRAEETGCDGVMFGRAIFGNPWLFDQNRGWKIGGSPRQDLKRSQGLAFSAGSFEEPDVATKLKVMVEHTELFEKLLGDVKNFAIMKKHYKAYVNGFDGAKELRMKLMEEGKDASDVSKIVDDYLETI